MAQWIRHRPTEPGIAGSSPAGVIFSTSALHAVLLLKLFDLHAIFSSPIPCSLFLFSFSVAFIFGFCWNLCIGMPGYLCFSLRFLQEKKGERERERERDREMQALRYLGCLNFEGKKKPEREREREREKELQIRAMKRI